MDSMAVPPGDERTTGRDQKKRRLGRGLGSLLGTPVSINTETDTEPPATALLPDGDGHRDAMDLEATQQEKGEARTGWSCNSIG